MDPKKSKDNKSDGCSWIKKPENMLSSAKNNGTSRRRSRNRSKGKSSVEIKEESVPVQSGKEAKKEEETVLKVQTSSPTSKIDLKDTKKSGEVSKEPHAGLELIEAVINKFKRKDDHFISVLEKVLNLFNGTDSKNCKTKLSLLDLLINNLLKTNKEELKELNKRIQSALLSTELVKYFVDSNNVKIEETMEYNDLYTIHTGKLIKPGNKTAVLVKKPNLSKQIMYEEAMLMSQLDHPNLIKLLAVDNTTMNLILEYTDYQLPKAIVMHKINVSSKNLMKLLTDVATGMEYLHAKKILHRYLSCDSIYVNKNNECKIGDFTHSVYVGDCNGEYVDPKYNQLYCVAPESEHSKKYTFKSDVWAMGIVCWETFKLISNPEYIHVPFLLRCVMMHAIHVGRKELQFSPVCPQRLYYFTKEMILHRDPSKRPTISELKTVFENINI